MDRVCHFEIPYECKDRMEKFYASVFDWQFHDAPTEHPYTFAFTTEVDKETMMPTKTGGINGGTYPRGDEGGSKTPVLVLEVEDTAAKIKMIEEAGGTNLIGPHEIPGMGIYAQVKDTEDNIIGLWQPLQG